MRGSHEHIYLDESGDLGTSSSRSSRYFVVAALLSPESPSLGRLMRRTRIRFGGYRSRIEEFKFNKDSDHIRSYVLNGISQSESRICWTAVDKQRSWENKGLKERDIYNFASRDVLSRAFPLSGAKSIDLVADCRRSKAYLRDEFEKEVRSALDSHHSGPFAPSLRIRHLDSRNCLELQAVDFVAGAVFQSVERKNDAFVDLLRQRIVSGSIIH